MQCCRARRQLCVQCAPALAHPVCPGHCADSLWGESQCCPHHSWPALHLGAWQVWCARLRCLAQQRLASACCSSAGTSNSGQRPPANMLSEPSQPAFAVPLHILDDVLCSLHPFVCIGLLKPVNTKDSIKLSVTPFMSYLSTCGHTQHTKLLPGNCTVAECVLISQQQRVYRCLMLKVYASPLLNVLLADKCCKQFTVFVSSDGCYTRWHVGGSIQWL